MGLTWFSYNFVGATKTYQYCIMALVSKGYNVAKTGDHYTRDRHYTLNHLQVSLSKFEIYHFNNYVHDMLLLLSQQVLKNM